MWGALSVLMVVQGGGGVWGGLFRAKAKGSGSFGGFALRDIGLYNSSALWCRVSCYWVVRMLDFQALALGCVRSV